MEWVVYFGIALISLENDAIACHISKTKLKLGRGIIFALFWPVTSVLAIAVVLGDQSNVKHEPRGSKE